jgi:hypothetical protein
MAAPMLSASCYRLTRRMVVYGGYGNICNFYRKPNPQVSLHVAELTASGIVQVYDRQSPYNILPNIDGWSAQVLVRECEIKAARPS